MSKSQKEAAKQEMARVKKNCPAAMWRMGSKCIDEGDYDTALEYFTQTAELGDAKSHYALSYIL